MATDKNVPEFFPTSDLPPIVQEMRNRAINSMIAMLDDIEGMLGANAALDIVSDAFAIVAIEHRIDLERAIGGFRNIFAARLKDVEEQEARKREREEAKARAKAEQGASNGTV